MDNKNKQQKPRKKGSGLWVAVFFIVVWLINTVDLDRLASRLSRLFRGEGFSLDDMRIVIGIVAVLAVALLILTITRLSKVRAQKRFDGILRAPGGRTAGTGSAVRGGSAAAHSHDQLQGYRGDESSAEHWKKQLDGFLEAGIIDRSEYRVLLERRRR